jgi:hypothetical protein
MQLRHFGSQLKLQILSERKTEFHAWATNNWQEAGAAADYPQRCAVDMESRAPPRALATVSGYCLSPGAKQATALPAFHQLMLFFSPSFFLFGFQIYSIPPSKFG